jgi:pimeloyl-ACP methyl ester carboxylesterase
VIAHGVGSSARFVREAFTDPVAEAGYRLVAYDTRGHGASTPVPQRLAHTIDAYADDLGAVVGSVGARLVGGVSAGAHAAVRWAARGGGEAARLDGVLACLPAWTGTAGKGEGPHAAVAREAIELGRDGMLARVGSDAQMPGWLREVLLRDWRLHDADSLVAALVALDGAEAPGEADLLALRCPLAVAGWPDDPGHPARVAQTWSLTARQGALRMTSLEAVGVDRSALGRAALEALDLARNVDVAT